MTLSFDPTEDREYTEDQARELWTEARRMAEAVYCDFSGWLFPEDPDATQSTGGFNGITFNGQTDFENARFNGVAYFQDAKFEEEANFQNVKFIKRAFFRRARFKDVANFKGALFRKITLFTGAQFNRGANFWKVTFEGITDFHKATFEDIVIFPPPFGLPFISSIFHSYLNEIQAYRLAKQAAQDHGAYQLAGRYHFAERCATNNQYFKDFAEKWNPKIIVVALLELFFARLLFGYGEKPQNPLIAAGVVIFLWAIFFWHFGGIEPVKANNIHLNQETAMTSVSPANPEVQSRSFGECLYFSIVTFTTLGYGDMRPTDDLRHRLLAGSEALLGVAIMALFIVSLARKYTR